MFSIHNFLYYRGIPKYRDSLFLRYFKILIQGEMIMTMIARITTDSLGNLTVIMKGGMDYESVIPLKNELINLTTNHPCSVITLDLTSFKFVGSSGINIFVDTIKNLNQKNDQIRLANVSSEFLKTFKLYQFNALELMMDEVDNETTDLNKFYGHKKRTFEN